MLKNTLGLQTNGGMSGGELAAVLTSRDPGLPVVSISRYGAATVEDHGIDTARLLEKPFGPGALLRTVRAAVDASRTRPAVAPASGR